MQYISNINKLSTQFKLCFFCTSTLAFENICLSFSGLVIESSMLHRHVSNCESSVVPALKLRQLVSVERYSEVIALAVDHVGHELIRVSIRKNVLSLKSCLISAC